MKRRKRLSSGTAKKMFKRSANRTHKKNLLHRPIMRGGIRL